MMTLAMPASRSLIALLVGTVVFFALWLVALKPGSSTSGGGKGSQGLGQYQSDINKAHQAVGISNASNAASGNDGTASSTPAASSAGSATAAKATTTSSPTSAKPASHSAAGSKHVIHLAPKVGAHNRATLVRLSTVQNAINGHKVVAMLFYNPLAADDQAVKQELSTVSTHHGRVVKLAIPLNEAANFTPVTQQVPINVSPTLVLIAPNGQVGEIVGFSDQFEIAQRVDDALPAKS
jgi:hypothetical protein